MKNKIVVLAVIFLVPTLAACGAATTRMAPLAAATQAPWGSSLAPTAAAPVQSTAIGVYPRNGSAPTGTPWPTEERRPSATPLPSEGEGYHPNVNPFVDTYVDHLSTFALDVDTASYTRARDELLAGRLPSPDSVRVEEFVNYFHMDYPTPPDVAFAVYADGAPSPFHSDGSTLLRIGVQGYRVSDEERKPLVLTFVIDVSGSMAEEGKLEMVKQTLVLLAQQLRPSDSVAIVAYSTEAWTVLDPTNGYDHA
jgi:Ca-activated chloride channel family protein